MPLKFATVVLLKVPVPVILLEKVAPVVLVMLMVELLKMELAIVISPPPKFAVPAVIFIVPVLFTFLLKATVPPYIYLECHYW